MAKRPEVLILTVPKSGSSSLYKHLSEHPEIFLPARKELHFFSRRTILNNVSGPGDKSNLKNVTNTQEEYLHLFSNALDNQVICELSTSYLYQIQDYVKEITGLLGGQLKIIVMLRHPVERCYSNYSHQRRNGLEKLDFLNAVKQEEIRKQNSWGTFWRYLGQSYYSRYLKALYENFATSNILVLTQEEFDRNPTETLNRIFSFIKVDTDFIPATVGLKYNKSGEYQKKRFVAWLLEPSGIRSVVKKLLPSKLASSFRRWRDSFISENTIKTEEMTADERMEVHAVLSNEIKELRTLYHLDYK